MSEDTLDRETLTAVLTANADPARVKPLLEAGLTALGWQQKDRFTQEEVAKLSLAMANHVRTALAKSNDPRAQSMGAGLGQMLDALKPAK